MKYLMTLLFIFILFQFGIGQSQSNTKGKPNFSGVWVLDEVKTKKQFGFFSTSNQSTKSNQPKKVQQIIIKHDEPKIIFTQKVMTQEAGQIEQTEMLTSEATFFTDKRGEENTRNNKTEKSVTTWNGKKIQIVYLSEGKKTTDTAILSLSKNGNTLTINSLSFSSNSHASNSVFPSNFGGAVLKKTSQ